MSIDEILAADAADELAADVIAVLADDLRAALDLPREEPDLTHTEQARRIAGQIRASLEWHGANVPAWIRIASAAAMGVQPALCVEQPAFPAGIVAVAATD